MYWVMAVLEAAHDRLGAALGLRAELISRYISDGVLRGRLPRRECGNAGIRALPSAAVCRYANEVGPGASHGFSARSRDAPVERLSLHAAVSVATRLGIPDLLASGAKTPTNSRGSRQPSQGHFIEFFAPARVAACWLRMKPGVANTRCRNAWDRRADSRIPLCSWAKCSRRFRRIDAQRCAPAHRLLTRFTASHFSIFSRPTRKSAGCSMSR